MIEALKAVAAGELRPAYVPARPPSEASAGWTVEPHAGMARGAGRAADGRRRHGDARRCGRVRADAPGAELLVAVGVDGDGEPVAAAIAASAEGVSVEAVMRYDATRSLGNVTFDGARAPTGGRPPRCSPTPGTGPGADRGRIARRGADVPRGRRSSTRKERFTFGRAIGSYQAIKHELDRDAAPP